MDRETVVALISLFVALISVLATVSIAVVGYVLQYFYYNQSRKDKQNDLERVAIGVYYFDLISLLDDLHRVCGELLSIKTDMELDYGFASNKIYNLTQTPSNEYQEEKSMKAILEIYNKIQARSSDGGYVYLNQEVHIFVSQLVRHIGYIQHSRSKKVSDDELKCYIDYFPLPNIKAMINSINSGQDDFNKKTIWLI